ncbi:hypothetical protein LCGC14_0795770 [marine sediment metagenome]|uniref:Uncharacterized protein n=1 Tax=marine sediment metagenome TaxID=412755 RepID=A0A0F9SYF0_9ZZZZ
MSEIYRCPAFLFCNYELLKRPANDIAKECNVSDMTIYNWMKKFNIISRTLSESFKGRPSSFKGHKHTNEAKEKNRQAHIFSDWNRLTYAGKHKRMRNAIPKGDICEECGEKTNKLNITNIDHKYLQNTEDWEWKCRSCHQNHDIKYNERGVLS